ncbi:hypothetical protein ACMHYB_01590 [Sorangium sp. So ce1128]
MPVTSTQKESTLTPGQRIHEQNFKGHVNIKNQSSGEASFRINASGLDVGGEFHGNGNASQTCIIPQLSPTVEVVNTSKEATISVEFVPR